jgi:hypothetical protein
MDYIIASFEAKGISPSSFIINLFTDKQYLKHPFLSDLSSHSVDLCNLLKKAADKETTDWATNLAQERYTKEVQNMVEESPEWRFSALHASSRKVEEFKIDDMAKKIENMAPALWNLLGDLLSAKKKKQDGTCSTDELPSSNNNDDSDEELWGHFGDFDMEAMIEKIKDDDQGSARQKRKAAKKNAILVVVS